MKIIRLGNSIGWLVVLLLCTVAGFASQKYRLAGSVVVTGGAPASDGFATLYRSADTTLVRTSVATAGNFDMGLLDTGSYLIQFDGDYYQSTITPILLNSEATITLTASRKQAELKEVQISGTKNPFTFSRGNIKARVANTTLSAIAEPIEVLTKLPTVQVSADRESVNIVGRGEPLIYLNHQRITLNELSTLSVNDIAEIEIINHPPASYEADGRAVILVTRVRNSRSGFKGELTEAASMKRFFENRMGINSSWKSGKTEWKANAQHNNATRFEGIDGVQSSDRYHYNSNFGGTSVGPRNQYLFGLGMYRQLEGTDYFQLGVNGRIQEDLADVNTRSFINRDRVATSAHTVSFNTGSRPFGNASFNYQKTITSINAQLFVGGQYSQYRLNNKNAIDNDFNGAGFAPSERRRQNFLVNVAVGRLDFKKNIGNDVQWESGASLSRSRSVSVFDITYLPVARQLFTDYRYAEDNTALYTMVTGTRGKVQYNAGLRLETTLVDGQYADSSGVFLHRDISYLFPRLQLTLPLDSTQSLTLTTARSISRPNYANANQVSNYITPFLEWTNNINIYPSITTEVNLNYSNQRFQVELTAYTATNPSWYVTRYDSVLDKVSMMNTNLSRMVGGALQLVLPFSYRKLTSNNVFVAQVEQVRDARATASTTRPYYYLYSSNQLQLPKGYTLTATAWLNTAQRQGVFHRRQQYSVDLAVSKTFCKKLTATIGAYDIFRSLNYVETYSINNINAATTFQENQKELAISLKYTFGTMKDTRYQTRVVNEDAKRLN